ncbi:hypothetical protein WA026_009476 [Henosepilachna vigintioctopunctata]|uniref:Uncharacterized protein n=1 Tax=Henosepilachna vigintioctopunctata TaxID=420089 RepID=A0AAW1TZH8_9CUCU
MITKNLSFNTPTSNKVYLKVKNLSQLQAVTSEHITIPDDPPVKDDEPVIIGNNIMPQVEQDPLAGDPLADSESEMSNQNENDKNIEEDKCSTSGFTEVENGKNENVIEVEEVTNINDIEPHGVVKRKEAWKELTKTRPQTAKTKKLLKRPKKIEGLK